MLKKIISHVTGKKTKNELSFFDLPSREQKKIVKEAAKRSNKDQLRLVKEFESKFGNLQTNTCK